ncbi:peptide-modifying radical SAM enzyme CbpB [Dechloromonas denitrificans]|uniref:Peptide-modifying radical SAM enzyme CbpB n=1 Tax=Dechloromonas denitrificans TaxID=281362 RepID=A0A133XNL0_9RHOO|nr:peptide-modifying radical SAM enzyme CbpB [Dechloromonas denitrificans]KXB32536.1 peptide-modifying radical SAM enzyme CbpB [Dechloromonas denitrificans]
MNAVLAERAARGTLFQPVDIGHPLYAAVTDPQTAFWALVDKNKVHEANRDPDLLAAYGAKAGQFEQELHALRFGLKPSGVYLNPTERCNLNCTYCYLPDTQRSSGTHMSAEILHASLGKLRDYFRSVMPADRKPRAIFHGAEPLMNALAVFEAIDAFADDFVFGLQTNGTLLDDKALDFLTSRNVSIGLSLDGPVADITDATRRTWGGKSVHDKVLRAMEKLRGYGSWSVITTCTTENLPYLTRMVELFHAHEVPTCMLNTLRCTLPGARGVKPADGDMAKAFFAAMDRTYELYQESGRKLMVANFANILIGILAPTARRLMCDISPCGGGRAFFALAADGSLYPCSEFIGLPRFNGGSLLLGGVEAALDSAAFREVTTRDVDRFSPCGDCAIRHFCGSPCPAEAVEMNGGMDKIGAFCDFYKEQVNYALRLIADGKADDYLWDGWDEGTETVFALS